MICICNDRYKNKMYYFARVFIYKTKENAKIKPKNLLFTSRSVYKISYLKIRGARVLCRRNLHCFQRAALTYLDKTDNARVTSLFQATNTELNVAGHLQSMRQLPLERLMPCRNNRQSSLSKYL